MLRFEEVTKHFRRGTEEIHALRATSFTIAPGEFVAIVGASGSGKTTLLSVLGGMLAPSTGQVWIEDRSLYDISSAARADLRRKQIGFVFQTFNLVPYLTAAENVQVPLMLSGVSAEQQQQQLAAQLLERVGLSNRAHHKPCELSIGQQQRVALARTLANSPAVILADEPTGNLDPQSRQQIIEFFIKFASEGRTVIMVTHDPVAAAQASRVLKLADGAIIEDSLTWRQNAA